MLLLLLLLQLYFDLQLFEYLKVKPFSVAWPLLHYSRLILYPPKRRRLPISKCSAHMIKCLGSKSACNMFVIGCKIFCLFCLLLLHFTSVAVVRPKRYNSHKSAFYAKSQPSQVSLYFSLLEERLPIFRSSTRNQYQSEYIFGTLFKLILFSTLYLHLGLKILQPIAFGKWKSPNSGQRIFDYLS